MNWEICGRKWFGLNIWHKLSICLELHRKTTKSAIRIVSQPRFEMRNIPRVRNFYHLAVLMIMLSVKVVDTAVQVVLLVVLLAWLPVHDYCGLGSQHFNWIIRNMSSGWRSHVTTCQKMAGITAKQHQAISQTVRGGNRLCQPFPCRLAVLGLT